MEQPAPSPAPSTVPPPPSEPPVPGPISGWQRFKRILLGGPKDFQDPHLFHSLSLAAFLAWVGLGADGLSSSAYGPEEAFKNLGEHQYLAVFLAALLVDYVLTITTSIAAGGEAVFSNLPQSVHSLKLPVEFAVIGLLTVLNLRGVKESVRLL